MLRNIGKIFSQEFGFNKSKLNSLARILNHFDALEDLPRVENPQQSDLDKILQKEIAEDKLNEALQKNIFQKIRGTKERQQIDPSNNFSTETKQQLMQDFEKIGFVAEVSPNPNKKYESVIIFGATQAGMETRFKDFLEHFLPQINEKPKEIFMLVGDREGWLDSEIFAKKILLDRINSSLEKNGEPKKTMENLQQEIEGVYANQAFSNLTEKRKGVVQYFQENYKDIKFPTETDIAKEIVESKKTDLDGFAITFIGAEKKPDGSRPNTEDTLKAFVADVKSRDSFELNSVLAISNQPYVSAQAMAINANQNLMGCGIDVIGKECSRQVGRLNNFVSEFAVVINRCPIFMAREQIVERDRSEIPERPSSRAGRASMIDSGGFRSGEGKSGGL